MSLRSVAAAAACIVSMLLVSQVPSRADGMPAAEDENYNPVPSKPGVPAPGVTQPAPIKPAKPVKPVTSVKPAKPAVVKPAKPTTPLSAPAPVSTPAPATTPTPPAATPAPDLKPAPVPATEPAPVPQPTPTATPPSAPPVTAPPPAAVPVTPPATPVATPAPLPSTDPAVIAGKKPVFEIINVDVQVAERQPPFATVLVKGTARTGGWKNMELRPLQTFAPEVGMRSFTLVGTPPDGPATQAITTVTAAFTIDPLPADVKTIRVLAETNEGARTFR